MFSFENEIWNSGYNAVAGIDEVGRGPIAGPVVAAAVVIPRGIAFPSVKDSKKLTERQRLEFREEFIKISGLKYSISEVKPDVIDRINILRAAQQAMKDAVLKLTEVDFALIDGLPIKNFPIINRAIIKGDSKSASIAAASIIAKIHRDELMKNYALVYKAYGFDKNKGYGTAEHIEAVKKYGPSPIHRKSFAPIKELSEIKDFVQSEFDFL
ncbi:MAG: ribonuclease HII [Victivallales bacterium]|nr:ribonuclease HII [Victivallales bacterium]MCF7889548.1 ribonuclease HII [Victivallales bacterium]